MHPPAVEHERHVHDVRRAGREAERRVPVVTAARVVGAVAAGLERQCPLEHHQVRRRRGREGAEVRPGRSPHQVGRRPGQADLLLVGIEQIRRATLRDEEAEDAQRVGVEDVVAVDRDDVGAAGLLQQIAIAADDVAVVLDPRVAHARIALGDAAAHLLRIRARRPVVQQHPLEVIVALVEDRVGQGGDERRIDVVDGGGDRVERLALDPRPRLIVPATPVPGLLGEHRLEPCRPPRIRLSQTDAGHGQDDAGVEILQRDDVVALGQRRLRSADEHVGHHGRFQRYGGRQRCALDTAPVVIVAAEQQDDRAAPRQHHPCEKLGLGADDLQVARRQQHHRRFGGRDRHGLARQTRRSSTSACGASSSLRTSRASTSGE